MAVYTPKEVSIATTAPHTVTNLLCKTWKSFSFLAIFTAATGKWRHFPGSNVVNAVKLYSYAACTPDFPGPFGHVATT